MAWDQQPLAASPDEYLLSNGAQVNVRREGSKADRILGTAVSPIQQHEEKKRGRRPSFLRTPEIVSRKPSNFVAFPTPAADETPAPQHLRVRASSPLLGKEQPQEPSPPPSRSSRKPWKKIHAAGSSNTLYSHFNPRDSTADSILPPDPPTKDTNSKENNSGGAPSRVQSSMSKEQKSPMKESKRKIRPPKIDLSLLFPKPRPSAAPLLSPQRLTSSPSQASFNSEAPPATKRSDGKRLTASHLKVRRPSEQDASESSEKENHGWPDNSLERTVRTSEFDIALDRYDELQKCQSKSTDRTIGRKPSHSSAGGWSKDMYLSPNPRPNHLSNRVSSSPGAWSGDRRGRAASDNRPISKKSSKSTLQTSDLNTSSVLCLSSSEDEGDEDEEPVKGQTHAKNRPRDSTATYDDFESEICTASAAQATKGPTLKRVDRNLSTSNRPRHSQRNQPTRRQPSTSSAGKSSYATRRTHSRRSSGAPTTTGPESHQGDWPSQHGTQYLSPRELRRRSRVMAVTRQEEHLLEAMRIRKGKPTPSLFGDSRSNGLEPDRSSMVSGPSRDSFYSTDMSFLRLSTGPPPLPTDPSAAQSDQGLGTGSDNEHKTINSTASPRASLVYSESLPSPTTSGASPLTPTLPIHRFSPLPSQKPPPRHPPPAVPQEQKQHSRRRTDSSEAIVLDEADENKEQEEFPIWAFGLDNERGRMSAVH